MIAQVLLVDGVLVAAAAVSSQGRAPVQTGPALLQDNIAATPRPRPGR